MFNHNASQFVYHGGFHFEIFTDENEGVPVTCLPHDAETERMMRDFD